MTQKGGPSRSSVGSNVKQGVTSEAWEVDATPVDRPFLHRCQPWQISSSHPTNAHDHPAPIFLHFGGFSHLPTVIFSLSAPCSPARRLHGHHPLPPTLSPSPWRPFHPYTCPDTSQPSQSPLSPGKKILSSDHSPPLLRAHLFWLPSSLAPPPPEIFTLFSVMAISLSLCLQPILPS